MRYWIYAEPAGSSSEPIWTIMSDDAIIATYWEYWEGKMLAHNRSQGIPELTDVTAANCIYDWVVVHWATEVTPEALEQFISAPKADNSVS